MLLAAKVIGILLLLAGLAAGVHWCASTIHKAGERDAALERVRQVEQEKLELARTFADAQAADVGIAAELAGMRADQASNFGKFHNELSARPLTHEVPRETLPDGTCAPVRVRDPVRYRRMFNAALGAPAP